MIDNTFDVRPFLTRFCDSHYKLSKIKPLPLDWEILEKIQLILRPFEKFTEFVSHEEPSIQLVCIMYTDITLLLRKIQRKEGTFIRLDNELVRAVEKGITTFNKYFGYLEESDFYYLSTVFNPRIKTE